MNISKQNLCNFESKWIWDNDSSYTLNLYCSFSERFLQCTIKISITKKKVLASCNLLKKHFTQSIGRYNPKDTGFKLSKLQAVQDPNVSGRELARVMVGRKRQTIHELQSKKTHRIAALHEIIYITTHITVDPPQLVSLTRVWRVEKVVETSDAFFISDAFRSGSDSAVVIEISRSYLADLKACCVSHGLAAQGRADMVQSKYIWYGVIDSAYNQRDVMELE